MGIKSEDTSPHLNAASSTASASRPSVAPLSERLRDRTTLRFMGNCKCGNCQLVPRPLLDEAIQAAAVLYAVGPAFDANVTDIVGRASLSVDETRADMDEAANEIERLEKALELRNAEVVDALKWLPCPPPGVETEGVVTPDDIAWAKAAKIDPNAKTRPYLEWRLAIEREKCAKVCDARFASATGPDFRLAYKIAAEEIRALLSTSSRGEDLSSLAMTPASLPASDGIPSEWQPIETAPKDGTSVLLIQMSRGDYEDRQCVGWFVRQTGERWITDPGGPNVKRRQNWTSERWQIPGWEGLMPTHWMPLPSAPIGSQASE